VNSVLAGLQSLSCLGRNQDVDIGRANCSNHGIFDQLTMARELSHPRKMDANPSEEVAPWRCRALIHPYSMEKEYLNTGANIR
jgi:hypothetical protein